MMEAMYFDRPERSGYADVLQEQSDTRSAFHARYTPVTLKLDIPDEIGLPPEPGLWLFLYPSNGGHYSWLFGALSKVALLAGGTDPDKAYANLALRQAAHVSQATPRIYNAPEGGVVVESRTEAGILTLLIEGPVGLIVRSSDDFHVRAQFNITPASINELLARYAHELKLLLLPVEN
jgi:hypothetical protein